MAAPVDPLGGSYYVEALTDGLEERIRAELAAIEQRGGTLTALAAGYQQGEIADAAYDVQRAVEAARADRGGRQRLHRRRSAAARAAAHRPGKRRSGRSRARARFALVATRPSANEALGALREAATGTENLLPRIRTCVEASVTLGEIAGVLRAVWGEYRA